MNEQVLYISTGGDEPVDLQVTVFTPDGSGPFPLAVINHGAPRNNVARADEPRHRVSFAADHFLSRGYAVVMPMMRGFAGSGGQQQSEGCDYERFALNEAADIEYMERQTYLDPNRIVVTGQSFGGWNTLALGSLNLKDVKGLVNYVGGMRTTDCSTSDDSLIAAAGRFGARTRVPSIWFYGDNDRLFSVATWRAMYSRYVTASSSHLPRHAIAHRTYG
jgi:dienelactone hydrolase